MSQILQIGKLVLRKFKTNGIHLIVSTKILDSGILDDRSRTSDEPFLDPSVLCEKLRFLEIRECNRTTSLQQLNPTECLPSIRPSNKLTVSASHRNDLKRYLQNAKKLTIYLESSENIWNNKCTRLQKSLIKLWFKLNVNMMDTMVHQRALHPLPETVVENLKGRSQKLWET